MPVEPFELIEPAVEAAPAVPVAPVEASAPAVDAAEAPAAEEIVDAGASTPLIDAFEAAARLFAFTGEHPVQAAGAATTEIGEEVEDAAEAQASAPHVAPRRARASRGAAFKRIAATSFSIGVVGVVGLLTVGLTTPASAVAAANGTAAFSAAAAAKSNSAELVTAGGSVEVDPDDIQVYVASADIQNEALDRSEGYSLLSMNEIAAQYAIAKPSDFYVNDMNAAIQWPFAVGVGITWGYQMRDGRMHNGADFIPGEGAHIQAIAEGTVRIATEAGASYGVTVVIDHIIDGQLVSTRYAHMLRGSLQVKVGDHVSVGQYLGRTGNTGYSFGAHTHVEVLMNGTTPVDPIVWLRANAGRDSLG